MNQSNFSTPTNQNQPQFSRQNIVWAELAPRIIEPVAMKLFASERPIYSRDSSEIRFGNYGSLVVNLDKGVFHLKDPNDETPSYGVIGLVQYGLGLDKSAALSWLKDNGYLDNAFTVSDTPLSKANPKNKSRRGSAGQYDFGLRLWRESKPIPRDFNHAARRWAAARNLLPPFMPFPPVLRYGVYADYKRGDRPYIIAFVCTLDALAEVYPNLPKIEPLKVRWQTLWIDLNGNSVDKQGNPVKRGGLKNLYGGFGDEHDYPVMCLGDPTADNLAVCEGIADALAIYSRCPGAVTAMLGSPKLTERSHTLECLARAGRTVTIFNDLDAVDGAKKLKAKINSIGGRVRRMDPNEKDPADAAALDPFPVVDRTKFDAEVALHRQAGRSESERDAWFSIMAGGGSHV